MYGRRPCSASQPWRPEGPAAGARTLGKRRVCDLSQGTGADGGSTDDTREAAKKFQIKPWIVKAPGRRGRCAPGRTRAC
jgi:hypothetical protein